MNNFNKDSLVVMHRDYNMLVKTVYNFISREVGYNKFVRAFYMYCPLYLVKRKNGSRSLIRSYKRFATRAHIGKRELFKPYQVKLDDMLYVLTQYWTYGKALEQYLESGVFDHKDFTDNRIPVSKAHSLPFWDLLWFITNAQRCVSDINGIAHHFYQLDSKPMEHRLTPILIKAFRQLTLYFYKVKFDYDENQMHNLINDYTIMDATAGKSFDNTPIEKRLTARQLERAREFIKNRVPSESILFAGSTFPSSTGSVIVDNYDTIPVYPHISFTFSSGATADRKNFIERRSASTPYELASYARLWGGVQEGAVVNARLKFVPKDIRKPRTICMEPSYLGILQQFYMKMMYQTLKSNNIDLYNQDSNRGLALIGSITGEWGTIDLSNASDMVMVEHVKYLFPDFFVKVLLDLRSNCVDLPNGAILVQRKYAAMGSALTFPVETLLFAGIAYAAGVNAADIYVYGDDIIVPSKYVNRVTKLLSKVGFIVNEGKTFSKGSFRESCGIFAYKGYNVTCVYRRTQDLTVDHIHELRSVWGYFPNFGFDEMPAEGALWTNHMSYDVASKLYSEGRIRFNTNLQKFEVRNYVNRPRKKGTLPDDLGYIEWLRLYSGKSLGSEENDRDIGRFVEPVIRKEWVPLQINLTDTIDLLGLIYSKGISDIPILSLNEWDSIKLALRAKLGWPVEKDSTSKTVHLARKRRQNGQHSSGKKEISRHTGKNTKDSKKKVS